MFCFVLCCAAQMWACISMRQLRVGIRSWWETEAVASLGEGEPQYRGSPAMHNCVDEESKKAVHRGSRSAS